MKQKIRAAFASFAMAAVGLFLFAPLVSLAGGLFYIDSVTGFAGFGNTTPQSQVDVSGAIYSRLVTATSSTISWNSGNVQSMTLTSSPTLTFTNGQAGGEYKLILNQDATGGRTVTWPASVKWEDGTEPTLTAAASSTDMVSFVYDGSSYLGSYRLNFSAPVPIAFDFATGTVNTSGSATSVSWDHTVSGSNRALVVFVYNDDATDKVTGVTYNSVAMTRVGVQSNASGQTVYGYLLLNPATGTHTVAVSASSGSNQLGGISASYTGVKQSGQPDSSNTGGSGSTGSTFSISTTVVESDSLLVGAQRNQTDNHPSPSGSETERGWVNTMTAIDLFPVNSGSRSLSWDTSVGAIYSGVVMSLAPAQ